MRGSTIRTEGKIAGPWQLSLHGKWGSWLNKNICWICNGNDQTTSRESSVLQQRTKQKTFAQQPELDKSTAGFLASVEWAFVHNVATWMSFRIYSFVKYLSVWTELCYCHNNKVQTSVSQQNAVSSFFISQSRAGGHEGNGFLMWHVALFISERSHGDTIKSITHLTHPGSSWVSVKDISELAKKDWWMSLKCSVYMPHWNILKYDKQPRTMLKHIHCS